MLTDSTANSYIAGLQASQSGEQFKTLSGRERGVNIPQRISKSFPGIMWTLVLNQESEVLTDLEREKFIDYLMI